MATDGMSIERLDWDNYLVWAANMKFFLTTKKCWHTVVSTEAPTTPEDIKADELALSYIGLLVKPHHQPTILRCTTANQAWTTLQGIFAAKSFARKLQLRRELNSLKMASTETVTAFTNRAKALQDQLNAAGHKVEDIDVACQVLAGLPSTFDTVVTVIETTTASAGSFTVDDILPHLLQAEQRRAKPDVIRSSNSALMASFHPRREDRHSNGNGAPRNLNGINRSNGPRGSGPRNNNPRMRPPNFSGPPPNFGPPRNFGIRGDERSARDARAFAEGTCLYCHKPGHYAHECNKKRRDMEARRFNQRPPPSNRNVNAQYSAIAFTAATTC
jgi:hypothetical protein